MRTNYLTETFPSDYDTSRGLACTIGKSECEHAAREIIDWLTANGDEWDSVPSEAVSPSVAWRFERLYESPIAMTEGWLSLLQRIRAPRIGPPRLLKGQLLWPNGKVLHASFWESPSERMRTDFQRAAPAG